MSETISSPAQLESVVTIASSVLEDLLEEPCREVAKKFAEALTEILARPEYQKVDLREVLCEGFLEGEGFCMPSYTMSAAIFDAFGIKHPEDLS